MTLSTPKLTTQKVQLNQLASLGIIHYLCYSLGIYKFSLGFSCTCMMYTEEIIVCTFIWAKTASYYSCYIFQYVLKVHVKVPNRLSSDLRNDGWVDGFESYICLKYSECASDTRNQKLIHNLSSTCTCPIVYK